MENSVIESLFNKYYNDLVMYCIYRWRKSYEDAEDAVMEAFMRLKRTKLLEGNVGYPLLLIYVKQVFYSQHKKANSKARQLYKRCFDDISESPSDTDILHDIIRKETISKLVKEWETLPPKSKEIFHRHMNGEKLVSIAKALGLSNSTVKTQWQRSITLLTQKVNS